MEYFGFGRSEGFPTQYASIKTAVTVDVLEAGLILAFVIIAGAYLVVTPGFDRKKAIYTIIKTVFSVSIGCLLMVENFGQEWEVGEIRTNTPYRAGAKHELINAHIGVKLGLRSVNVTLRAKPEENPKFAGEIVNYNERFPWTWDQGRFGFGPYAGLLQRSFREGQRIGLPLPILSVVDYLTIDGEGFRFGRFYRTAGWYTHILLWTAFPTWILANIFLLSGGRHTAYFLALTGGLQFAACIVWSVVRNPNPLAVAFENGLLVTRFGPNFWMAIFCGMLCFLLAAILLYMDLRHPTGLSDFLGIDPLSEYDEYVIQSSQYEEMKDAIQQNDNDIEMENIPSSPAPGSDTNMTMVMKRRSTIKKVQKGLYRNPLPLPPRPHQNIDDDHEIPVYENQVYPGTSTDIQGSTDKLCAPPIPRKKIRKGKKV